MSVTLFYCLECSDYSTSATITVKVDAWVNRRGAVWSFATPPVNGIPLEDIVGSRCRNCGGVSKLITLDECPHWWQKLMSNTSCRICSFCAQVQQGRIVWTNVDETPAPAHNVGTTAHWKII